MIILFIFVFSMDIGVVLAKRREFKWNKKKKQNEKMMSAIIMKNKIEMQYYFFIQKSILIWQFKSLISKWLTRSFIYLIIYLKGC
jgi:hypothetical protein